MAGICYVSPVLTTPATVRYPKHTYTMTKLNIRQEICSRNSVKFGANLEQITIRADHNFCRSPENG